MGLLDDAERRMAAAENDEARRDRERADAMAEDERAGADLWQEFLREAGAKGVRPDTQVLERDFVAWWRYVINWSIHHGQSLGTGTTPHRQRLLSERVVADAYTFDVPAYDPLVITADGQVVKSVAFATERPEPPASEGEAEGRWRETVECRALRASDHLSPRNSDLTPQGLPIAEAMIHRLRQAS